jgi:GT2 family glycosyltransferase
MSEQTWIVLVDFNGVDDTRKCLRSLACQTRPHQVVVVDNASKENVASILAPEFPSVHFVRNPINGGWAGGNNTGIRFALEHNPKLIVLLNNDTTVAPHFVERLEAVERAYPQFGIFGPVIFYMHDPRIVMTDGCDFNQPDEPGFFKRHHVPLQPSDPPHLVEVDIVNGCCMAIRPQVFRQIGLVDERFFLIHEESDFCLRARRAGWLCGVFAEGLVWHKGSSTFQRSSPSWQRYYDARNLWLLLRKHQRVHPRGRSPWRSRYEYLKYVYYRYSWEHEENQHDAAMAVIQGVYDALRGRWGSYEPSRRRPGLSGIRTLFHLWWCYRSRMRGANHQQ